jgi:Ca-activated chloride channel family protein
MAEVDLEYSWALFLFFLIPAFVVWKKRLRPETKFSAVSFLSKELRPSPLKRHGVDILTALFMVVAIMGIANVRYSSVWQQSFLESKWIMIVQDLSGSMNRSSGDPGFTLGDVALEGAKAFVALRRQDDLIGVVGFSSYARLIAPPTFDRDILEEKLALLSRKADSIVFRELTVGGATNASYAAWLALCTFFMLLPEESQLSYDELTDFRYSLLGNTLKNVEIPDKLTRIKFGHGMAIVLFTDGRIEANKTEEDVKKGLPNFVNVIQLLRKLGVKLYLIVVGGEVNEEVRAAMEESDQGEWKGQIFYMPRTFDMEKIKEAYGKINEMEKNRLLVKLSKKKKETRRWCSWIATLFLVASWVLQLTPQFRRI